MHPFKGKLLLGIFSLVLLAKIAETEWLTHLDYCNAPYAAGGHWANITGDSFSYIGAMENYVSTGSYYFINEKGSVIRAGRTPHFAIPYFLLRQLFAPALALDLFVLLQLMVESAAILCLALLVFYTTRSKGAFFASLVLSVLGLYVTVWSYNTFTDAVSTNLLVIALFFYYRYLQNSSPRDFIWFSVVLAAITCMRPYMAVFYIAAGIAELFSRGVDLPNLVRKGLYLALPLFILLAPWVVRNFEMFHRFIPFQQDMYAGYGFTENELAKRKVLTAMGEDGGSWWNRKSAASYFTPRSLATSLYSYPGYIKRDSEFSSGLESFRQLCLDSNTSEQRINAASAALISKYRSEYPGRYYFTNHLQLVGRFVFNNGSYHLPVDSASPCYHSYQYGIKLFQSLLFFLCLLLGTAGLVLMSTINRQYFIFLLPALWLILLFPVFFGLTEWRYFLPFYHFHQLGLIFLGWWLLQRWHADAGRLS